MKKGVKQHGRMPNEGGSAKPGSPKGGRSNAGATGGLRMEKGTNQGATDKPTTTNRFPNGLS